MSAPHGRLGVIFLTVLIDLIGFGIVIPILPYYAQRFGANGLRYGMLLGVFSGMQFLATTVLGRLSDRAGRRPILLLTMVINAAGYLLFAAAGSYALLFVARVVSGLASGNISVAYAYVADVTSQENRSKGMGIIGAAFGIGFTLGPALGGFAGHWWGHRAPGLVAAALSLINLVLAWRILKESLPAERRTRRPLWEPAHIREGFADLRLRALLIVWLIAPFAFAGYTVALPLFVVERFQWAEKDLGALFVVIGVTAAIVQGFVFGRLVRVVGDRNLLAVGTAGMALSIAVVPFVPSGLALYGWTFVLAFANSLFSPAASGMVSVLADPAEQGTMLGVAQSLGSLGRLVGPEVTGGLYDAGGARLSFLAAGAVMAAGVLAALAVPKPPALRS